jgi:two-component system OmpR family response regulator
LRRGLEEEGFVVDTCRRGDDALAQGLAQPYDAILLDLSLPGHDGLTVVRGWRERGVTSVVMLVTARSGVDAVVLGLNAGADDYICKPFSFEELLARLRAHLRRQSGADAVLRLGKASVDLKRRTVTVAGRKEDLSHREFQLLDLLSRHRGETLSRAQILDRVWGLAHDPTTNVVDVYVRHLRSKLDDTTVPGLSAIATERGRGYRLRTEAELASPAVPEDTLDESDG